MEKLIGEIQKTSSVVTKVRLTEFKGKNLLDIRDFFKPKNDIKFNPTKKGITLSLDKIPDMVTILEQAEAEAAKL